MEEEENKQRSDFNLILRGSTGVQLTPQRFLLQGK